MSVTCAITGVLPLGIVSVRRVRRIGVQLVWDTNSMQQIDFNSSGWTTLAADAIVKVVAVEDGPPRLYNILLGNITAAVKIPATDPRVPLAQKIAADLPAHLKCISDQARQFDKPPAYRMTKPPDVKPAN